MKRFVFVILVFFFSSVQAKSQQVDSIAYIQAEQFKIANVTLGSSLKAALKAFGKPDSIEDVSNGQDSIKEQLYHFHGVTALLSNSKVSRLECINPKHKTPQGMSVDDTINKLFNALGKTEIWQFDGREKVQYVLWPPCDTYMIFEIQSKRITKIILDFTP
jgi:hypothetical protein